MLLKKLPFEMVIDWKRRPNHQTLSVTDLINFISLKLNAKEAAFQVKRDCIEPTRPPIRKTLPQTVSQLATRLGYHRIHPALRRSLTLNASFATKLTFLVMCTNVNPTSTKGLRRATMLQLL